MNYIAHKSIVIYTLWYPLIIIPKYSSVFQTVLYVNIFLGYFRTVTQFEKLLYNGKEKVEFLGSLIITVTMLGFFIYFKVIQTKVKYCVNELIATFCKRETVELKVILFCIRFRAKYQTNKFDGGRHMAD